MSRTCDITGKRAQSGHKVSHSQIKTKRRFGANLQTKRLVNPATGETMRLRLSAAAIRTLSKWQAAGKKYDLRKLVKNER